MLRRGFRGIQFFLRTQGYMGIVRLWDHLLLRGNFNYGLWNGMKMKMGCGNVESITWSSLR